MLAAGAGRREHAQPEHTTDDERDEGNQDHRNDALLGFVILCGHATDSSNVV
jgi:hypothetical protein